jgi:hypothetical protein
MNIQSEENLSPALADAVQAAREVPATAIDAAQARLAATLQARPRRTRPAALRRWAAAGLTAMAALVLAISLPFLTGRGDAFAAVQAHFRQFRTLQMDITQHHGGEVRMTSRTRVDAAGATRTDIGDSLSIIVDPARGRVLTLLHEERQAVVAAILPHAADTGSDIAWLDDMRRYAGKATRLPETRLIAGQPAQGWLLDLRGNATELWADADGLPLEMRMRGGGLQIDYRFAFDVAFAPGLFDTTVPAGYTQVEADED